MRSIFLTLLLGLTAVITVGLSGLRLSEGDLARVFGAPAAKIGDPLYEFDPSDVTVIQLAGNGASAVCQRKETGWWIVQPWHDRMDPRAVQSLFGFTLGTRVEGAIPAEKVESANLGFADGQIALRFATSDDEPLAKFRIGHRTAWVGTNPETGDSIPTVFVEPRDKSRKNFLYACTDANDVHSLLGDGFKRLRDHHPFLFHPTIIESIRIRNRSGEMVLSRGSPKELWKIVKPLGLNSDKDALLSLVQGLYDLEAVNVKNRSNVTLPTADPDAIDQIALKVFGNKEETVLSIYPPENADATTVLAAVSDRPDAVFELPLTTVASREEGKSLTGLNDLPLSVNALRDPTLTSIDPRGLKSILISPAAGDDILIRRETPRQRFQVMLDGRLGDPNETALFSLLKAITEGKVADFVSDTATDLKPYGLDQPFLILRFLSFDGNAIRLDFGESEDGTIHAIREGTTTVVKIDPSMLALIPTNPWDWRNPALWSIAAIDVTSLLVEKPGSPDLVLTPDFFAEKWKAKLGSEDVTGSLSPERADIFLQNLLDLEASNWLRPSETEADKALLKPDMVFTIFAKTVDDQGEESGVTSPQIRIAKVKRGNIELCYGRVSTQPYPFLLDPEKVRQLEVDLFATD
ncbi:conserved hypothetical protein [Haloferula helveola]|uniref:DUF4340 domain-containing protein n=1 Tax=Haloferula helveola TaxID=490095 RepID=A0ABM7RKW4_9BACT|nr:conserved hypothetical protein [Haloferula helveola]